MNTNLRQPCVNGVRFAVWNGSHVLHVHLAKLARGRPRPVPSDGQL